MGVRVRVLGAHTYELRGGVVMYDVMSTYERRPRGCLA